MLTTVLKRYRYKSVCSWVDT